MKEAIENRKAYAATDVAINNGKIGGYWILVDTERRHIMQNTLYHKRWGENTVKGAEAIVLLELIIVIKNKGRNVESGKITMAVDNRKVY